VAHDLPEQFVSALDGTEQQLMGEVL